MNAIYRSLLAIALLGGFMPAKAMESQDPDKQENAANNGPKFTFESPNRESGLGDLSQLNDDNIFEIMLSCIDWDKTTLEDAFRTIQSLCQTSKYLYNLAHANLYSSKSVAELRKHIELVLVMEQYKQEVFRQNPDIQSKFDSNVNALHLAVAKHDLNFLRIIIGKLKKYKMLNLLDQKTTYNDNDQKTIVVTSMDSFNITDLMPDREDLRSFQGYAHSMNGILNLLLEHGAQLSILFILPCLEVDPLNAALLVSYATCQQIMDFMNLEDTQSLMLNQPELANKLKSIIQQNHKCNSCKFE